MRSIVGGICFVGLIAGAVWLSWLGAGQALSAHASGSWPSVTGTVVSAGFETGGTGKTYGRTAFVRYRYSVDGTDYAGERIAFGPTPNFTVDGTLATARTRSIKALATLTGGSDVAVYYDPVKPGSAVLVPGGGLFFLLYLFGAALMLGMAALLVLIGTGRARPVRYR